YFLGKLVRKLGDYPFLNVLNPELEACGLPRSLFNLKILSVLDVELFLLVLLHPDYVLLELGDDPSLADYEPEALAFQVVHRLVPEEPLEVDDDDVALLRRVLSLVCPGFGLMLQVILYRVLHVVVGYLGYFLLYGQALVLA